MPRVSVKENKNIYFRKREELGLTRAQASELLETIPPEKLEKIENERCEVQPYDVLLMADKYKDPKLCNYYCSNECPIGKRYVPEVDISDLSNIVLRMLSSLNSVQKSRDRLIDITADGMIDGDEIEDFIQIRDDLEKISMTVESLQLWSEQMLADGKIDRERYEECLRKREK